MEIISVTPDNIDAEHICCAITEKRGESCVSRKKAWMSERFADGLVFRKLDARGKVFIEYIPAEKAWCPIEADGYLHIDCFWVSGQYKGRGHATELLEACIADAREQGKLGITALSSAKKMPFLSDPKFLRYKGFETADTAEPFYELLYLPLSEDAPVPRFMSTSSSPGWTKTASYSTSPTNARLPRNTRWRLQGRRKLGAYGSSCARSRRSTRRKPRPRPLPPTRFFAMAHSSPMRS